MTSNVKRSATRKARFLPAVLAMTLMLLTGASLAGEWNLDQLMSTLAQTKSARAAFTEKKYLSALDKPVESSGELLYAAPDRLEKRTLKPKVELMLLEGDTLTLERGNKKYSMQLQESPELAALIDSIRGTLAGDRKALERNYALGLRGTREQWSLLLAPANPKSAQMIKHIRISGAKSEILEIEVLQTDGDRSVTTVEKTAS